MSALPGSVGRHAVNPYCGKSQSEQTKCADESPGNTQAEVRKLGAHFERGDVIDNHFGIEFMDRFLDCLCKVQGISCHPRADNQVGPVNLVLRQINERHW